VVVGSSKQHGNVEIPSRLTSRRRSIQVHDQHFGLAREYQSGGMLEPAKVVWVDGPTLRYVPRAHSIRVQRGSLRAARKSGAG
jgi:hypothetical protein